jgi:lipid II:glycine glycyltransferase (peptidoglycan interpeptide bridge formation enzyme)
VLRSPNPDFHQSAAWYDHLGAIGTDRRVLLVVEDDRVAATALFFSDEGMWTLWRGPVGEATADAFDALVDHVLDQGPTMLVLTPEWSALADERPELELDGEYVTHLLRLDVDPRRFLTRMAATTRNRVRRAQRAGVTVRVAGPHLEEFYALYAAEMRRVDSPDEASLEELADLCGSRGCVLLTAWLDGRLAAGTVALDHGGVLNLRYVATAPELRVAAPMNLLYHEAMLWGRATGHTWLDVSGIATGTMLDERTAALNRFKAGFGCDARLRFPAYRVRSRAPAPPPSGSSPPPIRESHRP